MFRRNTWYLSEFGSPGGNATLDALAFAELRAHCAYKGDTAVIDRSDSGAEWILNFDLWKDWPTNGGKTIIQHGVDLRIQQTLMSYHLIEAPWETIGNDNTAGRFTVAGGASWLGGTGTAPADRAAFRFGDTHGEIVTATMVRNVLMRQNCSFGTNYGIDGIIGFYGDGIQESSGLEGVIFQGFRQCASFPYAPSFPPSSVGRNGNFRLLGNNFNNPTPITINTSAAVASGDDRTIIPLSGTVTQGGATFDRTQGIYPGDYLGVMTSAGWHMGVVISVSSGVSATIFPGIATGATIGLNAEVQHSAVCLDVYAGGVTRIERNTAVQGTATATRLGAPNVRIAGYSVHVEDLHAEDGIAAVELGGYMLNQDGTLSSNNITVEQISATPHALTGNAAVRIHQHTAAGLALKASHAVLGSSISGFHDGNTGTYHFIDGGDTVFGRDALTLDTATYGHSMPFPYVIGPSAPGSPYGPRGFTQMQCGRRTATLAAGNIEDFDPTHAEHFRDTADISGSSVLRSMIGGRNGRKITRVNVGSYPYKVAHNASAGSSEHRFFNETLGDMWVGPNERVEYEYGVGTQLLRWSVQKVGKAAGSFTASVIGCTGVATGTIEYSVSDDIVTLEVPANIFGTSNTTACVISGIPLWLIPAAEQHVFGVVRDNSNNALGRFVIGTIGTSRSINSATLANPLVLGTSAAHGWSVGQRIYAYGALGLTQINGNSYTVGTVPTTTSLSLSGIDGTSGYSAWTSGGTLVPLGNITLNVAFGTAFTSSNEKGLGPCTVTYRRS